MSAVSLRVGLDVVTVARVQTLWQNHRWRMLEAFLTVGEWAECRSLGSQAGEPVTHAQLRYIAVRFAAKEAVIKAMHLDMLSTPEYSDIEVLGQAVLNVRLGRALQDHARTIGLLYWTGSGTCTGPHATVCLIAVCSHD